MKKEIREFFDPHPGFGGPAVPLPVPFKELADKLAGKKMTVEEAIKRCRRVTRRVGGVVEAKEDSIALYYPHKWHKKTKVACHFWRLIRHRPASTA